MSAVKSLSCWADCNVSSDSSYDINQSTHQSIYQIGTNNSFVTDILASNKTKKNNPITQKLPILSCVNEGNVLQKKLQSIKTFYSVSKKKVTPCIHFHNSGK